MAFIDIDRTYESNKVPTQDDFDNIVDGIEVFLNVTGVSDDNLQNASITASTKLIDYSITQSKLGIGSIATTNVQDSAITANKLDDNAVTTSKIADASITLDKVTDNLVGVYNIVDGAIDPIHITPNHLRNTWSSNTTVVGWSGAPNIATIAEKTITTNGGLLRLSLNPMDGILSSNSASFFITYAFQSAFGCNCLLYRDGTRISATVGLAAGQGNSTGIALPFGGVVFYDTAAAGTYTYTVKLTTLTSVSSNIFSANYAELNIWEL